MRTLRGRNSRPHKKKSSVPRASDFSMSRENPAISCSSSPSVATGEPRKPPLQVLHEELLPLPSTDGTLQLRNRWFADSSAPCRQFWRAGAGSGSPREWVFVQKCLLERKRSYLTENELFLRKVVKGAATEPINFIKEESHGTRSTPHRHRT